MSIFANTIPKWMTYPGIVFVMIRRASFWFQIYNVMFPWIYIPRVEHSSSNRTPARPSVTNSRPLPIDRLAIMVWSIFVAQIIYIANQSSCVSIISRPLSGPETIVINRAAYKSVFYLQRLAGPWIQKFIHTKHWMWLLVHALIATTV